MVFDRSFWNSENVKHMYGLENAERQILHPRVLDVIKSLDPTNILDYGCGDGYMSSLLSQNFEVSLFDKNKVQLEILKAKFPADTQIFFNEVEIPTTQFDCILLSQVIMCLDSHEEISSIAKKLKSYKKPSGHLVVVITHPCFLQYEFGHWYTSFSKGQPFHYLNEGEPYTVYMRRVNETPISFTDYNWPIQTIINTFLLAKFKLKKVIEHPDMPSNREWHHNPHFPHYMFLIFN